MVFEKVLWFYKSSIMDRIDKLANRASSWPLLRNPGRNKGLGGDLNKHNVAALLQQALRYKMMKFKFFCLPFLASKHISK